MTLTLTLDLEQISARFPALAQPVVHADAPGGTQVPTDVIEAIADYLRMSNANSHGVFATSTATDALCERVRGQVARFVGGVPDGVVFGPNMTTLTWHFARAFGARLGPDDELVCTQLDHDANVAPWLAAARRTGARVRFVHLDAATGTLQVDALDEVVNERTRLVAFTAASNALGTIVDPRPFVAAARRVGALTFLDAVHAAPHVQLDQRGWGVDVLVCSPYKFFGPHLGVLSADPAVLSGLVPDRLRPAPDAGPERWQTGTAQFELIAGTGAALAYLDEVGGPAAIAQHEAALSRRFLDGLADIPRFRLHGIARPEGRTPTFALTADDSHPDTLAAHLAERGVYAWSGDYYALEVMRALGLAERGGALRIGFVHYHGPGDVDRVLAALAGIRPPRPRE